jgi:maleylpyruvate isomerase
MKLYLNEISSAASRVRIALALKGITADTEAVTILGEDAHNLSAAYRSINPQGLVPALLTDSGALLTQSIAIIEYLDELQPQPPLLPADLERRALCRAVALAIAAEIHALVPPRVARRLSDVAGMNAAAVADWNRYWVIEGMHAVEALLTRADMTHGPYIGGALPSLADILLFPQALNATRMGLDLAQWPVSAGVVAQLYKLPAFVDNGPAARN